MQGADVVLEHIGSRTAVALEADGGAIARVRSLLTLDNTLLAVEWCRRGGRRDFWLRTARFRSMIPLLTAIQRAVPGGAISTDRGPANHQQQRIYPALEPLMIKPRAVRCLSMEPDLILNGQPEFPKTHPGGQGFTKAAAFI